MVTNLTISLKTHKFRQARDVLIAILVLLSSFTNPGRVQAQEGLVRCILFYSPTCPHCHDVITETLPPLIDSFGGTPEVEYIPPTPEEEAYGPPIVGMYGEKIEILYVNTYTELGYSLFSEAIQRYHIPPEQQAVPLMIINNVILIGGAEIPQQFSVLVDAGIAAGGVDWPDLPGLEAALSSMIDLPTSEDQPTESPQGGSTPEGTTANPTATGEVIIPNDDSSVPPLSTELSVLNKIRLDPLGSGIAILVLLGMLATIGYVAIVELKLHPSAKPNKPSYLIPVLCILGIVVAGYLSYIEASGELAVCGPIGDCNTVQQSEYAILFGFLPVGIVGLIGYLAITVAWLITRLSSDELADWSSFLLFLMTAAGTLFSVYLTFLEPFVIGAICAWCLSSAVIITLLFWFSKDSGLAAYERIRNK